MRYFHDVLRFHGYPDKIATIFILAIFLMPVSGSAQSQEQRDDWDLNLVLLHNAIEITHPQLPKNARDVQSYLDAMEIDAEDRKLAYKYAQEAQAAKNDFYYSKFMDLAERAQDNGNEILMKANIDAYVLAEGRCVGYHCWCEWGFRSEYNGIQLFQKAQALSFDQEITRGQVRYLMNLSMDKMESQGPWVGGEPAPRPDPELHGIDHFVREICLTFKLQAEYDRATEIMNRYLIEVLCKLSSLGHQYFLDLANQYKLERAKRHIEGFYGFVMGKVEVDLGDGPKPARGATVKVIDPHDDREWSATADNSGDYVIEKAILHKKCSPFRVIAEFEGDKKEESIEGPLDNPNPAYWFEKNFLFKKKPGCGFGSFHSTETWDRTNGPVHNKGIVTRSGQVSFDSYINGVFKGTLIIHYFKNHIVEDTLSIETYTDEGTATVPCELLYSWGSPRPSYDFNARNFVVQRHEVIVHKPFSGRGWWTETKDYPVTRSQTGYIDSGTKNKPERWALELSGLHHKFDPGQNHVIDYTWNFHLCKPAGK